VRNAPAPPCPRPERPAGAESAGARLLQLGAAVLTLGLASPVHAQIAASVSLQTDYRVRGASVSETRPAASLTVSDDLANGVYFGASVVGGKTHDAGYQILGHTEYLGYAHRTVGGLTWDIGVDNFDFELYPQPQFHLSYSEAYVGLSNGAVSSRVYISPNYLQEGLTVVYLELNGVVRPSDDWRLSGHLGYFAPVTGYSGTPVRKDRLDVRLDVVRRLGPTELNLGWTNAYPQAFPARWRSGGGVVAGVTAFF
jgi:uncharacterized protein (TIGR02001 family)